MSGDTAAAAAAMARGGLPVLDSELPAIARMDVLQRPMVDALYAVSAARYADPALIFSAVVTEAPWH